MNEKIVSFRDHPSLEHHQAAERKLCRLFASFGLDALIARDRLIEPYLERAATYWRPHSGADFSVLALQEAEYDLENWFVALLGDALEDRSSAIMTGRAAFLMCGGPERWADQLLRPTDEVNSTFIQALLDHLPSAVPPSELGEMHHQPYEAWTPGVSMFRALPANRSFFQGLAGLIRRDAA